MKNSFKTFLLVLVVIICSTISLSYFYMLKYKPKNLVVTDYYLGLQELENGDKQPFIEVNSYKDCFEIKFNKLLNNSKTAFFTQGIQFYGNLNFNDVNRVKYKRDTNPENIEYEHMYYVAWMKFQNAYYKETWKVKDYNSMAVRYYQIDNNGVASGSANPINPDSTFKISVGEDIYEMRFKLNVYTSDFYIGQYNGMWTRTALARETTYKKIEKYKLVDVHEFARLMYDAVGKEQLLSGTSTYLTFNYGDMFNFYKVDKTTGKAEPTAVKDSEVYDVINRTYIQAKVTRYDSKIKRASDSLFGIVNGNSNFDTTGGDGTLSYFMGRGVINVSEKAFLQSKNADGTYTLRLSEKFIKSYLPYKTKIKLNISIDLDYLDSLGGTFTAVEEASLSDFEVYKIVGVRNGVEEAIRYEWF